MRRKILFIFHILLAGPLVVAQANVRVESVFEPSNISLSNAANYKIIIHGVQTNPQGSVPQVSGLNLSNSPRIFRSASFINGVPSIKTELSFEVRPQREGSFTVPSWKITAEGKKYSIPAATLQVLPPSQRDLARQREQQQQEQDLREAAFLEFSIPRPFLFKGESTPAKLSLFLWDKLPVTRIDQLPQKTGDGFSLSSLGQPEEQRNVVRGNKAYSVFHWKVGLTGALSGQNELSFTTAIRVRVKGSKNSPFGNPFFSDPFFGFGREQSLEIKSAKYTLEVRDLPSAGRPPNFQGAIGSFQASSSIDLDRVSLGDPVRLKFAIEGSGNFAAMPAPDFPDSGRFRAGPPAFSFTGDNLTKLQGTQTFEYVLTPLTAGLLEVPPIEFSYFDPIQEKYLFSSSMPHPLRVDPGEKWAQPQEPTVAQESRPERISTKDLFQTESEPGEWKVSLAVARPFSTSAFWILQVLGATLSCGLLLWKMKKRDPKRDALIKKEKLLEGKLSQSLKLMDAPSFYQTLRKILSIRIGRVCNHDKPSALSTSELVALLQKKKFSTDICDQTELLLQTCDNQEYAAENASEISLKEQFSKAEKLLKQLGAKR